MHLLGPVAIVLLEDIVAAFYAQIALHDVPLRSKKAKLSVRWYELEDEALFDREPELDDHHSHHPPPTE